MQTTEDYRAFWRRMVGLYYKALAQAKTEREHNDWLKRIAEAEARAGITPSPNQPDHASN